MKYALSTLALLGVFLITPAEGNAQEAKAGPRHMPNLEECDTNKDGFLSKEEFLACFQRGGEKKFAAMDANGDGKLTEDEMKTWREERRKNRPGHADGEKGRRPERADGEKGKHKRFDFAECDTNKDGFLSKEEFLAAFQRGGEKKFAAMDKDGDGKLSQEEITAWREARKAKRHAGKSKEQSVK